MAFISFLTRRAAARALLVVACGAGLAAHAGPLRAALDDDDGMDAAVAAAPLPASVRVLRDQPYGPHPRQRMDVYLPPHAHDAPVLFRLGEEGEAGEGFSDSMRPVCPECVKFSLSGLRGAVRSSINPGSSLGVFGNQCGHPLAVQHHNVLLLGKSVGAVAQGGQGQIDRAVGLQFFGSST